MTTVAILGAGAWGTALAVHLATRAFAAPGVVLYARDRDQCDAMRGARANQRYLPGVPIPPGVGLFSNLSACATADLLIAATPASQLEALASQVAHIAPGVPLFWLSKGFVRDATAPTGYALAHQVLAPRWKAPVGIVSGPSFASEVARGLPTALAIASTQRDAAEFVAQLLRGETMRTYPSDDLAGIETGSATKNVLAIAAGASDGLGFGHNARAALITRGLAETGRLSAALGGRRETLMGLAGLGDLVLTCTGDLSRNRRVGLGLARGEPLSDILAQLGHVAEGVEAAKAAAALAKQHDIEMPIVDAVHRVLYDGQSPRDAVADLLRREPKAEFH